MKSSTAKHTPALHTIHPHKRQEEALDSLYIHSSSADSYTFRPKYIIKVLRNNAGKKEKFKVLQQDKNKVSGGAACQSVNLIFSECVTKLPRLIQSTSTFN